MKTRLILTVTLVLSANTLFAEEMQQFEVSITNTTLGQSFTPRLVATHNAEVSLFTLGQPASVPLELLAEAGDTEPLIAAILSVPNEIGEVLTDPELLLPGQTTRIEISAHPGHEYLTFAAMLLPTNDTFVALSGVKLPKQDSVAYTALAYDAGTEENDQKCIHIPGPRCGGAAHSMASDTDEGFVYISNGFHELGDMDAEGNEILGPKVYDWRNSVAYITIKRIAKN